MTLWIILTAMCSAAAVLVAIPLIRRYEASDRSAAADAGVYADQLKELERDKAQGLISTSEADLAKVEIERRLLAATKQLKASRPISPAWRTVALAAVSAVVVLGATNLYVLLGRPDLGQRALTSAEAPAPQQQTALPAMPQDTATTQPAAAPASGNVDDMITQLAGRLKADPSNADGWRMLGWSYFNTRRFDESANAYAKAVELDPANMSYKSAYAEALVQAAGGIVTPKASGLFADVLAKTPKDERSRFYMALAREQAGDFPAALDQWIALFADAPKDAGWLVDVRQRISDLGQKTGRDVASILEGTPAPQTADGNSGLSQADQQAMVDGMVAKLSAKLEANPRDRDGWAMMIRSLKVRGDLPGARKALSDALAAFADDPSTRIQIAGLAQSLGVTVDGAAAGSAASTSAPPSPGPTQQDVAAAAEMTPEARQAMISGMVDSLAARLDKSPHDADGWVKLIRSRMVLNQPDMARDALRRAINEFSADPAASTQIAQAAKQLGVTLD